jgi:hypothetical protein
MKLQPANDTRPFSDSDLWFRCPCGSQLFQALLDRSTGRRSMRCEKCMADHTMALFA